MNTQLIATLPPAAVGGGVALVLGCTCLPLVAGA